MLTKVTKDISKYLMEAPQMKVPSCGCSFDTSCKCLIESRKQQQRQTITTTRCVNVIKMLSHEKGFQSEAEKLV